MNKNLFKIMAILGYIIIVLLAFTIPKDPYIIIPSYSYMSFDKPLWLCIIIVGWFFYSIFLSEFYDFLIMIQNYFLFEYFI